MLKKISELEKYYELDDRDNSYLNEDNHYGTIYVYDNILNERRAGIIPKCQMEIHIEGNEGFVPHFHLCYKSGKNVIMRIKLLDSEYFREKDDVCNVLNSKQRKALNEYLRSDFGGISGFSCWQELCAMWNQYNQSHMIDLSKYKQPDYTTIKEPK